MKYTESVLQSWTAPLSKTEENRAEHAIKMIKSAVNANADLESLDIDVFNQGSFANNTNVRSDSDVDVCVMLRSSFYYDLPQGKTAIDYGITPTAIEFERYRKQIKKSLEDKFGYSNVIDGNKSIKIKENTYHVQADVVPAIQYRRYTNIANNYFEGIRFYAKDGTNVTNFPKIHIKNGIKKNNDTNGYYKKLVRIMKHIKNNMSYDGIINSDTITSFLVECLLYNIPNYILFKNTTWSDLIKWSISYLRSEINNNKHKNWTEVSELLYLFYNRKWTDKDVENWLISTSDYLEV